MPKIKSPCIDVAHAALRNFDKEQLEDYVRRVFVRAKEIDDTQGAQAMQQASKEVNDAMLKDFFSDATQKARNISIFENRAKSLKDGETDMRGQLAGRELRHKYFKQTDKDSNSRKNAVSDSIQYARKQVWDRFMSDLSHEEFEHLTSNKFQEDIADVVDGKSTDNAMTRKIADKIKDYLEFSKTQLILSGAMKVDEFHPRRYFRQVHDVQRIIAGGKSWIKSAMSRAKVKIESNTWWKNLMKQYIDVEETFKKTKAADLQGNISPEKVDAQLDRSYDNITSEKSQKFTRSQTVNDREAVQRKNKLFYIWKNLRSQLEYNKSAGTGDLYSMLSRDMEATAQKVGVARSMGDNPFSMYLDLKKIQDEVKPESPYWWENTDHYFNSVMQLDKNNIAPSASTFLANLRQVSTMAALPAIVPMSLSDIGFISMFAKRYGESGWKAWGDNLIHLFNAFPTEERIKMAKLMQVQVNAEIGHIGRWADDSSIASRLNKMSTKFFKANFLEAFDRGNKIGAMTLVGKKMFNESGKSWESLPEKTREYLGRFIDKNEWNLLRDKNSGKLFSTENVDNVTNDELRAHYEKTDKSIPLSDLRDDISRRVYAMFTVASEQSVLTPGHFERVFMYHGTEPGSVPGMIAREVMHFKSFTLATIDRVLIDGLRNADGVQQKIGWGLQLVAGIAPLAYIGMVLQNVTFNKTMPNFDQMTVPQKTNFIASIVAAPLGAFFRFLDVRNQDAKDMAWSVIGSPSVSMIASAVAAAWATATGNFEHAGKQAKQISDHLLPINTTPIISPIIQQIFNTDDHLIAGQQHKLGQ